MNIDHSLIVIVTNVYHAAVVHNIHTDTKYTINNITFLNYN